MNKVELSGFARLNEYLVKNSEGEQILRIEERSKGLSTRFLSTVRRSFEMVVFQGNREYIRLQKPFRLTNHKVDIHDDHSLLGSVEKSFIENRYIVRDKDQEPCFELSSRIVWARSFNIENMSREEVGVIEKKWPDNIKRLVKSDNFFGMKIDRELSVEYKKILLGAIILIDFIHFN
ncbi:phospholipid scramblase-related protein [Alkalibacillus haloalkaliphilus]|uniref:phospholipid scramblase-related protein n=1 Tax=Alkalibacillus haloalkaliphilus TaxID=94136 RepID=UPI00293654FB|nr:phospholipid scramblase-related protein [Alkalibacillus haloalkaliphilus]MDV2583030.1 phospholipid scramblase-related protein [Alkalibacillus haloalkaliphilus]